MFEIRINNVVSSDIDDARIELYGNSGMITLEIRNDYSWHSAHLSAVQAKDLARALTILSVIEVEQ